MSARGLRVSGLRVYGLGGRPILRGVDLSVAPGELVLVAGPSGAGKTTLLRAAAGLAGLLGLRVEGSVRVDGVPVGRAEPGAVAYVPQEPWAPLLTPYVATELGFLGLGEEVARELGLERRLAAATALLSAGEAQRLAVAAAAASGARVLLVDEVTAYLDRWARLASARLLRRLADEGRAVVVVDHDLELWRGLADRVAYLEGGRVVVYGSVEDVPLYAARRLAEEKADEVRERVEAAEGEACIEARGLAYSYPGGAAAVEGLNLEAACPGLTVLRGPSGSGKTTVLKLLAGLLRPRRGRVVRRCRPLYVPENPLLYLSAPTVREELGGDAALARLFGLEGLLDAPITVLSAGERRRLALASASRRPGCVLVDEPTVGLDYISAVAVLEGLARAVERGSGLVVATHSEIVARAAPSVVEVGGGAGGPAG